MVLTRRGLVLLIVTVAAVTLRWVEVPRAGAAMIVPNPGSGLYPMGAIRLVDSREGRRVRPGPIGPQESISFSVIGSTFAPADATAVAINVTAVDASGAGYFTVWPTGTSRPLASSVNFSTDQTVANLVQVGVGTGGTISLYNSAGLTHVVVDLIGFYAPGGLQFVPAAPSRLYDSGQVIPPQFSLSVAGGSTSNPPFVRALFTNLTIDNPGEAGYAAVYSPEWVLAPESSTLNFAAGQTVANGSIIRLTSYAAPPLGGSFRVRTTAGSRVVADSTGWFTDNDGTGGTFEALTPCRAFDTRPAPHRRGSASGQLDAGRTARVELAGTCGLPADASRVVGVALNVTATNASATSHVTVWPAGQKLPATSTVNFGAGDTVPNHAVLPLGVDGALDVTNVRGSVDLVVDVVGFYRRGPGTPPVVATTVAQPCDASRNLVRNGGFEEGAASVDGIAQPVGGIPGWESRNGFDQSGPLGAGTVVRYGTQGLPAVAVRPASGGSAFWAAGVSPPGRHTRTYSDLIPLSAAQQARTIDFAAARLRVIIRVDVGSTAPSDNGEVYVFFLDRETLAEVPRQTGAFPITIPYGTTFPGGTGFVRWEGEIDVPYWTRSMQVMLQGHRNDGDYTDAFVDNVFLGVRC